MSRSYKIIMVATAIYSITVNTDCLDHEFKGICINEGKNYPSPQSEQPLHILHT